MQVEKVKCRWGYSWKLATFDAKCCQLSSVASLSHWASSCTFAVLYAARGFVSDSWSLLRYANGQTDIQIDIQTRSSQHFAPLLHGDQVVVILHAVNFYFGFWLSYNVADQCVYVNDPDDELIKYVSLYTLCLKKRPTLITCYNFCIHSSIATIFGTNVAEKVGNQNVPDFPITPN